MKKSIVFAGLAGLAASPALAQISIVPSAVPFTDISATGTSIGSIADDSELVITGAALTAAGFNGNGLLAGGVSIRVGTNGAVIWGNSATDTFTNATEVGWANPNPGNAGHTSLLSLTPNNGTNEGNGGLGPRQLICPLWDDNTPGTGGSIRWQVIGGDLYIQWTNMDHFSASGTGTVTYQMVVRGGVAIGGGSLIDFVYQDTLYDPQRYQNDGGSASIGFVNWGVNPLANDVEWGISGGNGATTVDPAFGDPSMQPKVAGWAAAENSALPHSLSIIPAPGAAAMLGLGGLLVTRRRR